MSQSALQSRLAGGDFIVTAEVTPPVSTDPADFVAKALPLKGLATAVNVTDGAGAKAHMATIVAAHFLQQAGVEPIMQMACRDSNRLALESDLLGALALGMRNFLVLTGDDPKAGDQPDAKPVFDFNSTNLLADGAEDAPREKTAARHRYQGRDRLRHRRHRRAGRSAGGLEPEIADGEARRRRRFHPDPVLHGYRGGEALWPPPGRARHRAQARFPDRLCVRSRRRARRSG